MSLRRRALAGPLAMLLLVAACAEVAPGTPSPSGASPAPTVPPMPVATERPFAPEAWPATGSACDLPGYGGRLGRIEAVTARTVRFTLCSPDGAFLARLAHPAMGVVDATSVDLVAADPASARLVPGAGAFRVEAWSESGNVQLGRVAGGSSPAATPVPGSPAASATGSTVPAPSAAGSAAPASPLATIVLSWAASSADRATALREAAVDGIDAPSPSDLAEIGTLPELAVVPRPGLATAYLGFGSGHGFGQVAVRRAFAQGIDHAALARDAFPAGSTEATHVAPCEVTGGCAGTPWYEFNGPAGTAALADAGFDRRKPVPLHVPDGPVPGLPDPAGVAAAVRDQLGQSLGIKVEIDTLPIADLAAAVKAGRLDGLYLGGIASPLADASGYLEPLFGEGATGAAATRARGVRAALDDAAGITGAGARSEAYAAVNDAVRSSAPIVPLVHPGSTVAYRADVTGVAISPLGADPLGDFAAGDRSQLVVMQAAESDAAWCAGSPSAEALRLCALVTPGLVAFDGASLMPVPALATRCVPSADATVWTCRLPSGLAFTDGKHVDAGDVLASLRAQGDAGSPLRAALPTDAFAAWDELFDGPVPATPASTP